MMLLLLSVHVMEVEVEMPDSSSCDSEEDEKYSGKLDESNSPQGRGTIEFSSGDRFEGKFRNGKKEGKGTFFFSDGSSLSGIYQDDALTGKATYIYSDGSYLVATYTDGELNGPAKEFHSNGNLCFEGVYVENIRYGVCHFWDEYGAQIFGRVDAEGQLSGDEIIYVYPDGETALKGRFKDAELIEAKLAKKCGPSKELTEFQILIPEITFQRDVSTKTTISKEPLLKDPFETKRCFVGKSEIQDAGEGLFAKIDVETNEVMAFYNGIRLSHQEVDARDWKFNENTISLDDEVVIDVPKEFSSADVYCATLGHKANHSFTPNAKYDRYDHPRFGKIKCIRTIRPVKEGEEVTVEYGYDHNGLGMNNPDAPPWYKHQLEQYTSVKDKKR